MDLETSWTNEEFSNASLEIEDENEVEASERGGSAMEDIVGMSVALQRVLELARVVAPTDATALIQCETGTGKELIAEAIHKCSDRAIGPLVKVDCSASPARLLASELFGHDRRAYTG